MPEPPEQILPPAGVTDMVNGALNVDIPYIPPEQLPTVACTE